MNTDWLSTANSNLERCLNQVNSTFHTLAEPRRTAQLRQLVYVVAGVWAILSLAQMTWLLFPKPQAELASVKIANPTSTSGGSLQAANVDLDALAAWDLFGKSTPQSAIPPKTPAQELTATSTGDLNNIEDNARETRLALTLQGVVASSDPDIAVAVIEHNKKQQQYRLGDKLPVGGQVSLAKILPDRVVIDNKGKYELLLLFDKNSSSSVASTPQPKAVQPPRPRPGSGSKDVAGLAQDYRQKLYNDPQSLADVVKISAVRTDGSLSGYRISPGKDREQFTQLGFKSGDIVTGVNGIALTDPGKAMELYRIMRNAKEASFDLLREGESVNVSVSFGDSES